MISQSLLSAYETNYGFMVYPVNHNYFENVLPFGGLFFFLLFTLESFKIIVVTFKNCSNIFQCILVLIHSSKEFFPFKFNEYLGIPSCRTQASKAVTGVCLCL